MSGSADELRARLHALLVLWAEHGLDREHGGCWNRLTHGLEPVPEPHKRLLVFEWVWLLHGYARARGGFPEALQLAELLHRFARRRGVDADGLVFDALGRSGRPSRDSKRLWPQTEHLKALAARGEQTALRDSLARVVSAYVDPATHAWREQLDRAGQLSSDALNATSVYHVVLALREAAAVL